MMAGDQALERFSELVRTLCRVDGAGFRAPSGVPPHRAGMCVWFGAAAPGGVRSARCRVRARSICYVRRNQHGLEFDMDETEDCTDRRLLQRAAHLARQLTSGRDRLAELELILPREYPSERDPLRESTAGGVHRVLEAKARSRFSHTAVEFQDRRLDYAGLEDRSARLASRLRSAGAERGTPVAVLIEPSEYLPVALLAILKCGCSILALDANERPERIAASLGAVRASLALTQGRFSPLFREVGCRWLLLDTCWAELDRSEPLAGVAVDPRQAALVTFLPGLSGELQAVAIPHAAMASLLQAAADRPGLSATDALLASTALGLDAALLEIFLPLWVGARVVIAAEGCSHDAARLVRTLEQHEVTVLHAPGRVWHGLVEAGWQGRRCLRAWYGAGGLAPTLESELIPRVAELWKLYGPAESTLWATAQRVVPGTGDLLFGSPLSNARVFIVDDFDRLVAPGAVGEICIGGAGVASGYLTGAAPGADRFGVLRLPSGAVVRVFRTRDLGWLREDGALVSSAAPQSRAARSEACELAGARQGRASGREAQA
jgi:non-ribosomal peptide synthetase component F